MLEKKETLWFEILLAFAILVGVAYFTIGHGRYVDGVHELSANIDSLAAVDRRIEFFKAQVAVADSPAKRRYALAKVNSAQMRYRAFVKKTELILEDAGQEVPAILSPYLMER
ncbi:MAG: hypothetical protein HGA67_00185 [Candidatus Yonathbacteria bacterium]|nr:hypothetical protein [Candidatus Yonathbacteria bacterium]